MFLSVGCLYALEFPSHPKLATHKRHARYLMYHDFGTEEGVSRQEMAQVGTDTWCRCRWWNDVPDVDVARIPNKWFVEVEMSRF